MRPESFSLRSSQRGGRGGPTLDHVWLAAALLLIALRPLLTPIPPHDFWWHVATGRLTVAQGAVPTVDSFSYTRAGLPFYNQGWLAQVVMYGLYEFGGLALILIVQSFVIVLAYGLLLRLCVVRTGRLRLCVALLLLTTLPLSFDNWNVRPQSYAFPLFVGFLVVLTEYRLGRRDRLWLLPLLMVVWVNVHGTFVLGLGLMGVMFVGEVLRLFVRRGAEGPRSPVLSRGFVAWGVLTGLAVLLNPRGVGVIWYVRNLLGSNAVTTLVTEWAPPTIHEAGGAIFFLFLICFAVVLVYARHRPDGTDMLICGVFLWMALGAVRNVVWFGFVATPLLAVQAASFFAQPRSPRSFAGVPALNALLIGLLGFLLVIGLPWVKPLVLPPSVGALVSDDTPSIALVSVIRQQPGRPSHLFHAMGYGSYLIWAVPEQKVFIDPRIELYPYEQWRDYINLGQANNVAELMRKYALDGLLLSKREQELLIAVVRKDAGWVVRYEDERTIYLTRR